MAEWGDETGKMDSSGMQHAAIICGWASLQSRLSRRPCRCTTDVDRGGRMSQCSTSQYVLPTNARRARPALHPLEPEICILVFGSPVSTVLDETFERPLHLFWSRGTHSAVLASSRKEDSASQALQCRPASPSSVRMCRRCSDVDHGPPQKTPTIAAGGTNRTARRPLPGAATALDVVCGPAARSRLGCCCELPNDTPHLPSSQIGRCQPPDTGAGGRRRRLSWWAPLARSRDLHQRTLPRPAPAVPAGRT